MSTQPTRHMLSFDVEEYFHCEVYRRVIGPGRWHQWPSRLDGQMDALLALLDGAGVRATFFVLGRIAEDRPHVVRRLAAAGHEIACHSDRHEMLTRLDAAGFARDTAACRKRLEDLCGQAVLGYRAPTFSVMHSSAWALDVLAEQGFLYDSSVQPVRHDRYGVPEAPATAHVATGPGGGRMLEIPPMTLRCLGRNWPLGGGGYFRLLPVSLFDRALHRWAGQDRSAMLYLHPWELDPHQPQPPIGALGRFRHRVNLHRTAWRLEHLLSRHRFGPVRDVLDALRAGAAETFQYGHASPA